MLTLVTSAKMGNMILCTLAAEDKSTRVMPVQKRRPPLVKVDWSKFATDSSDEFTPIKLEIV
jgi:hypothetical protein